MRNTPRTLLACLLLSCTAESGLDDPGRPEGGLPNDTGQHEATHLRAVVQLVFMDGSLVAFAGFFLDSRTLCHSTPLNVECRLIECVGPPEIARVQPELVSGGPIEISVGRRSLKLLPDPAFIETHGYNYVAHADGIDFSGGDPIVVRIAGTPAGPPSHAFSTRVPHRVALTSPAEGMSVNRSRDLVVTWNVEASSSNVRVIVGQGAVASPTEPVRNIRVECDFDGRTRRGEVATLGLSHLEPGEAFLDVTSTTIVGPEFSGQWRFEGYFESQNNGARSAGLVLE